MAIRPTIILLSLLALLGARVNAQVPVALAPNPRLQFFSPFGAPLAGGCVGTYVAGTNNPQATYTDSSGLYANSNPITLDSTGSASIWLANASYRIVLYAAPLIGNCSSPGPQIWLVDNVTAWQQLNNLASLILVPQTSLPSGQAGQVLYSSTNQCFEGFTTSWNCFLNANIFNANQTWSGNQTFNQITAANVNATLFPDYWSGTDICAKITSAQSALPSGGVLQLESENYSTCASTLNLTQNLITLNGAGAPKATPGATGGTTLNFPAATTGIIVSGTGITVTNLGLKSASTTSGGDVGILLASTGAPRVENVTITGFGAQGLSFAGTPNNNDFWYLKNIQSSGNFGDGFAQQTPCTDNNAGQADLLVSNSNGGWGFNLQCGQRNLFGQTYANLNTSGGYNIGGNVVGDVFQAPSCEAGTGSSFVFNAGSSTNVVNFSLFGQCTTITTLGTDTNVVNYVDASGFISNDKMELAPPPGTANAVHYAFRSGQYNTGALDILDRTHSQTILEYLPSVPMWYMFEPLTVSGTVAANGFTSTPFKITYSTTPTINLIVNGFVQQFACTTAGAAIAPTLTGDAAGYEFTFIFVQNGTTACTLTFPANMHGGTAVGTTLNGVNIYKFIVSYNGTDAYQELASTNMTGGTP